MQSPQDRASFTSRLLREVPLWLLVALVPLGHPGNSPATEPNDRCKDRLQAIDRALDEGQLNEAEALLKMDWGSDRRCEGFRQMGEGRVSVARSRDRHPPSKSFETHNSPRAGRNAQRPLKVFYSAAQYQLCFKDIRAILVDTTLHLEFEFNCRTRLSQLIELNFSLLTDEARYIVPNASALLLGLHYATASDELSRMHDLPASAGLLECNPWRRPRCKPPEQRIHSTIDLSTMLHSEVLPQVGVVQLNFVPK